MIILSEHGVLITVERIHPYNKGSILTLYIYPLAMSIRDVGSSTETQLYFLNLLVVDEKLL